MNAAVDKELVMLEQTSREFSRKVLAPEREENDAYPFGPFFQHVLKKAFDMDLFHIMLPEDRGGIGLGMEALCVVLNNICREESSLGGIIFTTVLAQEIMLAAGADDMLDELVGSVKGVDDVLIAFPVLDDPNEIKPAARAVRDGDGCRLSGKVTYLVLGGLAPAALIPAVIDGDDGVSLFLVETGHETIYRGEPVLSHGLHACPAVDVELNGTPATPVGEAGNGGVYFEQAAEKMQTAVAAMLAGIMKGSYDEAAWYCRQRRQGGRLIKDWSQVRMMLADMAVQVQAAEMLVAGACRAMASEDKNWPIQAGAAFLHIRAAAAEVVTSGIQAMGGVGYMKDFGQEKRFRDVGQIQAFLGLAPMKKMRFLDRAGLR